MSFLSCQQCLCTITTLPRLTLYHPCLVNVLYCFTTLPMFPLYHHFLANIAFLSSLYCQLRSITTVSTFHVNNHYLTNTDFVSSLFCQRCLHFFLFFLFNLSCFPSAYMFFFFYHRIWSTQSYYVDGRPIHIFFYLWSCNAIRVPVLKLLSWVSNAVCWMDIPVSACMKKFLS